MSPYVFSLCAFVFSRLVVVTLGDSFLHAHPQEQSELATQVVREVLLSELAGLADSPELLIIEAELQPIFEALPKSEQNKLEPATVRYALHRYFVHKHGWFLKGLESSTSAMNSSSVPPTIMVDRAPALIQSLLMERLQTEGLGLHDLAVFAATLLDLIHKETTVSLESIFEAQRLPKDGQIGRMWSNHVVKVYLMQLFFTNSIISATPMQIRHLEDRQITNVYPQWPETIMWVEDLRVSWDLKQKLNRNPFVSYTDSFDATAKFVREIVHLFGSFQKMECQVLKDKLVDMEHQNTGRVHLSRFYGGGVENDGDWEFVESVDYLRSMGALDETVAQRPSVIIPNYINGPGNCLTSSNFYSLCCVNECEGLQQKLEEQIANPEAEPGRIASIVASMQSSTVEAPRNLSSNLLHRLDDIANHHAGLVPLHGRLFNQWMHHAYPRECPFPHISGTTNPLFPVEWMKETGLNATEVTDEEKAKHLSLYDEVARELNVSRDVRDENLPWTAVEELIAPKSQPDIRSKVSSYLRPLFALVALVSFMVSLLRTTKKAVDGTEDKTDNLFV